MLTCGGSSNIMRQSDPGLDHPSKLGRARSGTFNAWLQHRLVTSRLTQRQVAARAGIHHSTISRLLGGDRTPSLRTATSLAHALGMPDADATLDEMITPGSSRSRPAQVEYALRSDDSLTEAGVRQIMDYYLIVRRVRPAPPAAKPSGPKVPVPIVVQVPKDPAAGSGRHPGRIVTARAEPVDRP